MEPFPLLFCLPETRSHFGNLMRTALSPCLRNSHLTLFFSFENQKERPSVVLATCWFWSASPTATGQAGRAPRDARRHELWLWCWRWRGCGERVTPSPRARSRHWCLQSGCAGFETLPSRGRPFPSGLFSLLPDSFPSVSLFVAAPCGTFVP